MILKVGKKFLSITVTDCPDWYEQAWEQGQYPVPETFKEWSYHADLAPMSTTPIEDKKGIPIDDMNK